MISSDGVIDPYYLKDDNGASVTLTSYYEVNMLRFCFEPHLNTHEDFQDEENWTQQDIATASTESQSMKVVWEMFPGRLFSVGDEGGSFL